MKLLMRAVDLAHRNKLKSLKILRIIERVTTCLSNACYSAIADEFVDDLHFSVFIRAMPVLEDPGTAIISNNYVILCHYTVCYALGFTADGRIFINSIGIDSLPCGISDDDVVLVDDVDVKQILGYQHDLDINEHDTIDQSGLYRVQGDIVLQYDYDNYDDYRGIMLSFARGRIERFLLAAIGRYLQLRLADFGITARFSDIVNDLIIPARRINEDHVEAVESIVYEILESELETEEPQKHVLVYKRVVQNTDLEGIIVRMDFGLVESCGVTLGILEHYLDGLENTINDVIKERKLQKYKIFIGDHRIEIEALPQSFSITIEDEFLDKLGMNNTVITVSHNRENFFVLPGSVATLHHRQHGTKTIVFNEPGWVRFTTTSHDELHTVLFNSVALDKLVKQRKQCT